jgi:NAD(P)-dependent dehydrogenase (short-subunit alcohol dehydrogenase family)
VDALDEQAVDAYLNDVTEIGGSIDIVLNVMGPQPKDYGNQTDTLELPLEKFLLPFTTLVASQFITARAAARHMIGQKRGAILYITAPAARGQRNISAIGAAFGAMESLFRCLAADLGPAGVRVVGIRAGAMMETRTIQQSLDCAVNALGIPREQIVSTLEQRTLLGHLPSTTDTARLAAFLASDGARSITGAIVNASSGMVTD